MNYVDKLKKDVVIDGDGFNKRGKPYLTEQFPVSAPQNVLQTNPNVASQFQYNQGYDPSMVGASPQQYQAPIGGFNPNVSNIQNYAQMKDIGLQGVKQQAQGFNPYLEILQKQGQTAMSAASSAEAGAMQQQFTQQNLDPTTRNALSMNLARQQGMAQGQFEGEIAKEKAASQQAAQQQSVQLGMQAEQFELGKMNLEYDRLLSEGGFANIQKAEELFNQMSGGEDIDLSGTVRSQAYSTLGAYAQIPGTNIDEVIKTARQNGDLERLGITEQEARNMIEPIMRSQNPLAVAEAQYGQMLKAGDIDQAQYDDMMAIQKFQATNPGNMMVRDSYIVKDENGDEVGNFLSQDEANSFIAKNGGTATFTKDGYVGLKDEYQEYLPAGEGGFYTEGKGDDSVLYKNVDGQKTKVKMDFDEPFSENNMELIEHYGYDSENKTARKIKKKMIQAITNDIDNLPLDFDQSHPLYDDVLNSTGVQKIKSLSSYETGWGSKSIKKIEMFEGYQKGQLINHDGRLLVYERSNPRTIKGDDDIVSYYFYDPIDKTSHAFTTKQKGSGVVYK